MWSTDAKSLPRVQGNVFFCYGEILHLLRFSAFNICDGEIIFLQLTVIGKEKITKLKEGVKESINDEPPRKKQKIVTGWFSECKYSLHNPHKISCLVKRIKRMIIHSN